MNNRVQLPKIATRQSSFQRFLRDQTQSRHANLDRPNRKLTPIRGISALTGHFAPGEGEHLSLAAVFRRRGYSIMTALRRFTPTTGELSERLDKTSGAPASASHATYIAAFAAREKSF
jgi:hypothetical protein